MLADIGNTHIHLYDGDSVEHLSYDKAIAKYGDSPVSYITVRQSLEKRISSLSNWQNISERIVLEGAYDTMGVDRKALCLSHDNGLFVDAGSAITVDVMKRGVYRGGFILPGIRAVLSSYATISPVLETTLNREVSLDTLPLATKDGISYGIIAPIKAVLEKHQGGQPLYFSGGDGAFLSSLFEDSLFDETLVFRGMLQALKNYEMNHT